DAACGKLARASMPRIEQVFVEGGDVRGRAEFGVAAGATVGVRTIKSRRGQLLRGSSHSAAIP
ncbi:MAG TPA: hypothetical protein PKY73_19030, partial [Hyphomonas sp.]|nr:hypothetical protein [Hyphomonas sp.]